MKRVLLQDAKSREFLGMDGRRTKALHDAADFQHGLTAYDIAQKEGIAEFQIVFHFPETDRTVDILKGKCLQLAVQKAA